MNGTYVDANHLAPPVNVATGDTHHCGLIVVEGADCTGKTTLCTAIAERFHELYGEEVVYIHSGVADDIWRHQIDNLRAASLARMKTLVIMDRLWLSEAIYGRICRGGSVMGHNMRALERHLRWLGAVNVICTSSPDAIVDRWKSTRVSRDEYVEDEERLRHIAKAYVDFYIGSIDDREYPLSGDYAQYITRCGATMSSKSYIAYDFLKCKGDFIDHLISTAVDDDLNVMSYDDHHLSSEDACWGGVTGDQQFMVLICCNEDDAIGHPPFMGMDEVSTYVNTSIAMNEYDAGSDIESDIAFITPSCLRRLNTDIPIVVLGESNEITLSPKLHSISHIGCIEHPSDAIHHMPPDEYGMVLRQMMMRFIRYART